MPAGKVQDGGTLPSGVWTRRDVAGRLRHLLWRALGPLPDRQYCAAKYLSLHGRLPNLREPRRFTEKVQLRKLVDRNPLFPVLVDKIACKSFIAARVGRELVLPTLWAGTRLADVDWAAMPLPVVVKPSHASGVGRLLRRPDDVAALVAEDPSARWLAIDHARFNREWAYREVEPRILIEPAFLVGGGLPSDYRFYVFGGKVSHIEVDFTADGLRRYASYSPAWRKLDIRDPHAAAPYEGELDRPQLLAEMIGVAERLAADLDFARIDLLASPGRFYVGEVTLYPGGGFDRFDPDGFDIELGERWRMTPVATGPAAQSASRSR